MDATDRWRSALRDIAGSHAARPPADANGTPTRPATVYTYDRAGMLVSAVPEPDPEPAVPEPDPEPPRVPRPDPAQGARPYEPKRRRIDSLIKAAEERGDHLAAVALKQRRYYDPDVNQHGEYV